MKSQVKLTSSFVWVVVIFCSKKMQFVVESETFEASTKTLSTPSSSVPYLFYYSMTTTPTLFLHELINAKHLVGHEQLKEDIVSCDVWQIKNESLYGRFSPPYDQVRWSLVYHHED